MKGEAKERILKLAFSIYAVNENMLSLTPTNLCSKLRYFSELHIKRQILGKVNVNVF